MGEEEDFVGLGMEYGEKCGRMCGREAAMDGVWMGCGGRALGRGAVVTGEIG